MRRTAVCLVLLCLPMLAVSQDAKEIGPIKKDGNKTFYSFKVGDVGTISKGIYKVDKRLMSDELAIFRIASFRFFAEGASLDGLSDGDPVEFRGTWEVGSPVKRQGVTYPRISAKRGAKIVQK